MVRDNYSFFETVWQYSQLSTGGYVVVTSKGSRTTLSKRSDAVATFKSPVVGYYQATDYMAFFSYGTSHSFDYEIPASRGRKRRYWGKSSTQEPFPNFDNYGCQSGGFRPAIPASVVSKARSIVNSQVETGELNLATSLGESKEGAKMLIGALKSLALLARALRKRDYSGVKKALDKPLASKSAKDLRLSLFAKSKRPKLSHKSYNKYSKADYADGMSSAWLAYQYGWRPLIQDVYEGCLLMQNGFESPSLFEAYIDLKDENFSAPSPYTNRTFDSVTGQFKRGIQIKYAFKMKNTRLFNLSQLGLTNPAALVWELTPLSFVVDWLLPVNRMLQSLSLGHGLMFSGGYETVYVENYYTIEYHWTDHNIVSGTKPKITGNLKAMDRVLLSSFGTPPLSKSFEGFNESQGITAISLLQQMVR